MSSIVIKPPYSNKYGSIANAVNAISKFAIDKKRRDEEAARAAAKSSSGGGGRRRSRGGGSSQIDDSMKKRALNLYLQAQGKELLPFDTMATEEYDLDTDVNKHLPWLGTVSEADQALAQGTIATQFPKSYIQQLKEAAYLSGKLDDNIREKEKHLLEIAKRKNNLVSQGISNQSDQHKLNLLRIKENKTIAEIEADKESQILTEKALAHYAYPTETIVGPDRQDEMGFIGGRRGVTPYESESAYRDFIVGGGRFGRDPGEFTDPQEKLRENYIKQSYDQYPTLAKQTWGKPDIADIVSGKVTYSFAPEGESPIGSANRNEKTVAEIFQGQIDAANEAATKATGTSWDTSDIVAITEAEGKQMVNAILIAAAQLSREGRGFADVIASDIMAEPGYYANIINATDPDMVFDDPYTDYTPMKASKIVELYKERNTKQKFTIEQAEQRINELRAQGKNDNQIKEIMRSEGYR